MVVFSVSSRKTLITVSKERNHVLGKFSGRNFKSREQNSLIKKTHKHTHTQTHTNCTPCFNCTHTFPSTLCDGSHSCQQGEVYIFLLPQAASHTKYPLTQPIINPGVPSCGHRCITSARTASTFISETTAHSALTPQSVEAPGNNSTKW